jgi:hypothetical protein
MDQFTLLFRGAPIGTVRGTVADWVGGGDVLPLPSFDAVRAALADASRVLANYGFLPAAGEFAGGVTLEGEQAGAVALAAAQAICDELELRDGRGRLVPTDWINVFGGRTPEESISVMFTIEHDPAGTPARSPHRPENDSGYRSPAG